MKQAEQYPDALCVVDGDGEHSYQDMMQDAKAMAFSLKESGAAYGSRVLVSCDGKAHYLSMEIACWLLGAIFVPVEENASDDRITGIYKETDPVLFVSNRRLESDALCRITVSYEKILSADPENGMSYYSPKADDTAEILFTTGTTGKSKGVELTHANDVALAENVAEGVHMREGNRELIPLPISHAHAIRTIYALYLRH